jgi:hypothetical protein
MWQIETVYSADDGGWYCEVYGLDGRTAFTTGVYKQKSEARRWAQLWIQRATNQPEG